MARMTCRLVTWMLVVWTANAIPTAATMPENNTNRSMLDDVPGMITAVATGEMNWSANGFGNAELSSRLTPTPTPRSEVAGDADSPKTTPPATPRPPANVTSRPAATMAASSTPQATGRPSTTPRTVLPPIPQPILTSNSSTPGTQKSTSTSRSPSATPTQRPNATVTPKPRSTPIKLTVPPTKTSKPTATTSPVTPATKTTAPAHSTVPPKTASPAPKTVAPSTPTPVATTRKPVTTPAPTATTKAPIMDVIDTLLNKVGVRPTTTTPTTPVTIAPTATGPPATKNATTSKPAASAPTRKTPKPSTKTPVTKSPSPTPSRKTPTLVENIVIKTDNRTSGSRDDNVSDTPPPTAVTVAKHSNEESETQDNKMTTITTKTSLIIIDNTSTTEFHHYVRGIAKTRKPTIKTDNSTGVETTTSSLSADVITIGGRNRTRVVPGADVAVSAMSQNAHDVMRLGCCGFVIASMVLLVLFHSLALITAKWLPSHRHGTADDVSWLAPNTWELLVVAAFFQHLGSLSMLVLPMAPYYVVDFTDALSWTNFQISGMGTHEPERRLDYVILMGMVAYADRLGIDEGKLLTFTTRCFFVVAGMLVVGFLIMKFVQRWLSKRHEASSKPRGHDGTLCFLGLAVAVWSLSTFPLCASSSHELSMELGYAVTGDFVIVLFNLFFVLLGGLALLTWTVGRVASNTTMEYYHFAVFDTLFADHRRETRYTFVVFTLFQIFTGAVVGGIQDNPTQLVALLVLHGIVLFALAAVRPYRKRCVNIYTCVLMIVRIANLIFATAFTTTSTIATSTRGLVATSFVTLNFLVVLAIFSRQFLVFVYVLRLWSSQSGQVLIPSRRESHVSSAHIQLQSARLGSEYDPTLRRFTTRASLPTPCDFDASGSVESPVPNLANRPEPLAFRDDVNK